jgi:hypothetical protein
MSDYWLLNNLKQGTDAIANNHISAHKKDGNLVRTAIARKP